MIARRHKLLAAAAVLAIGVGAAWPLRRTEPLISGQVVPAPNPSGGPRMAATNAALKAQPVSSMPANAAHSPLPGSGVATLTQTSLKPASTAANGPVSANEAEEFGERIHVVHEGDSLERLAKRYLDDAGRAMEIFELNRQVLANPHLLPLGAELRIPARDRLPADRSASGATQPVK